MSDESAAFTSADVFSSCIFSALVSSWPMLVAHPANPPAKGIAPKQKVKANSLGILVKAAEMFFISILSFLVLSLVVLCV
jgi:hypothetical protein